MTSESKTSCYDQTYNCGFFGMMYVATITIPSFLNSETAPELTREHNAFLRVKHEKIHINWVIY